jgi:hypothetical protein
MFLVESRRGLIAPMWYSADRATGHSGQLDESDRSVSKAVNKAG